MFFWAASMPKKAYKLLENRSKIQNFRWPSARIFAGLRPAREPPSYQAYLMKAELGLPAKVELTFYKKNRTFSSHDAPDGTLVNQQQGIQLNEKKISYGC